MSIIFSTIELMNYLSGAVVKGCGFGMNFFYDFKILLQRYMNIICIHNIQMHQIEDYSSKTHISMDNPNILISLSNFYAYWSEDHQSI